MELKERIERFLNWESAIDTSVNTSKHREQFRSEFKEIIEGVAKAQQDEDIKSVYRAGYFITKHSANLSLISEQLFKDPVTRRAAK